MTGKPTAVMPTGDEIDGINRGTKNRNGWVGTYEQHRQAVAWFFEDRPAAEIARYLSRR